MDIKPNNQILTDKDVLGLDKATDQLRPVRGKKSIVFIMLAVVVLMVGAAMVFYFK